MGYPICHEKVLLLTCRLPRPASVGHSQICTWPSLCHGFAPVSTLGMIAELNAAVPICAMIAATRVARLLAAWPNLGTLPPVYEGSKLSGNARIAA